MGGEGCWKRAPSPLRSQLPPPGPGIAKTYTDPTSPAMCAHRRMPSTVASAIAPTHTACTTVTPPPLDPRTWCKRSTFWVTIVDSRPRDCSTARLSWAAFGRARCMRGKPAKLVRRQEPSAKGGMHSNEVGGGVQGNRGEARGCPHCCLHHGNTRTRQLDVTRGSAEPKRAHAGVSPAGHAQPRLRSAGVAEV